MAYITKKEAAKKEAARTAQPRATSYPPSPTGYDPTAAGPYGTTSYYGPLGPAQAGGGGAAGLLVLGLLGAFLFLGR